MARIDREVKKRYVLPETPGERYGSKKNYAGTATIAAMLKDAGLTWNVERRPLFAAVPAPDDPTSDDFYPVPGFFSLMRTDTHKSLGVVKNQFKVYQNTEAFAVLEKLVALDLGTPVSAACLHNGELTIAGIDMGSFEVAPGDVVDKHLVIANGLDGARTRSVICLPIRRASGTMLNTHPIVGKEFTLGLVAGTNPRTGEAYLDETTEKVLQVTRDQWTMIEENFKAFAATKIDMATHQQIIYSALEVTDKARLMYLADKIETITPQWVSEYTEIEGVLTYAPGMEGEYTIWRTYNAIAGWYDYMRTVRNLEEKPDNEFESRLLKHSATKKTALFDVCCAALDGTLHVMRSEF